MRFAVGVLLCLNVGVVSLALADPAPTSPTDTAAAPTAPSAAAPAAPASPAAPSAPPAAAKTPAAPQVDPVEKHFLAEGYKPEMRKGQKMFCRTEEILGSHLGGQKVCATLDQLKATETQSRESIERVQRTMPSPTGK